ncbi:hypothetical protein B0H13DRAFT_1902466 [Mycena leptocephala]|nr:hypothetical protein B0H13DRAFT_1902466 [Mycena leptocephala]
MKGLRGAFANGGVIVGERERRVRVEVRRRHAVIRTGSVRYPETPIRRRRDTDHSEIADDERDAGVRRRQVLSDFGRKWIQAPDRRERETSKRRDLLMMIIVSPGRIARKGQDAGENETFLNHERPAILRRRRLRSRRVRIPRIAQRLSVDIRAVKKTSFGLLIITGIRSRLNQIPTRSPARHRPPTLLLPMRVSNIVT